MSLARLHEHRRLWRAKPTLASAYRVWFDMLLASAPPNARVLEVGAGPGFLAEHARSARADLRWLASDLLPAPWNDLAADAGRLPLTSASVGAVLGLDVLHHLPRPRQFFAEVARVLHPDGRLTLLEPWITPMSWPVYRFLHQEACRLRVDPWNPFPGPGKDSFDGDAAVPWRLVRDTRPEGWRRLGFQPPRVRPLNAFAYLLSLGFRPASLLPTPLVGPLLLLDRVSGWLAPLTGLRVILCWERGTDVSAHE